MTVIGIDLGSHTASIAVWYDDKNLLEVLADDLGFRSIPCVVAFRGEETIVGHSAVSQQHKNTNNTFDEVRSLLFNHEQTHCTVPVLERDLTVEEVNSLFFRNIHNQVKQQAGKIIREAVVTVPSPLDEATKKRYIESAQAGGIRIKSFIDDSTATLLAYGFDDPNTGASRTLVVDLGWSRCTVSVYNVSSGAIVPVHTLSTTDVSGKIFVKLLADYCAKEFQRKHKIPCNDNKRAMMRLTRECEQAMKTLSTGGEAMIDIDSLCEGIDYSSKISRARFEDLLSIPIIHFKNLINNLLQQCSIDASSIQQICLAGGPSAMPKIHSLLKSTFPNSHFPKVRFETSEAQAIGAAVHGKHLFELDLLDNAPTQMTKVPALSRSILISNNTDSTVIFPANTPLPAKYDLPVQLPAGVLEASFSVQLAPVVAADPIIALGEVVVTLTEETKEESLVVSFALNQEGLNVKVLRGVSQEVVSTLDISIDA